MRINRKIMEKAKNIKVFLMDVDGVLTDGKIYFFYNSKGELQELKPFNALDGIGLMLLSKFNIITGIITGREAKSAEERARMLYMRYAYMGFLSKLEPLNDIMKDLNVDYKEVAYIGDDITDIPVLKRIGLSACPQNAVDEVKEVCDIVSSKEGGNGAVREICDIILNSQISRDVYISSFENDIKLEKKDLKVVLYSKWKKKKGVL